MGTQAYFGDWHGEASFAVSMIAIAAAAAPECSMYHVGDFGIWPGAEGAAYLDAVESMCESVGKDLRVISGNHEYWPAIEGDDDWLELVPDADEFLRSQHWKHLLIAPRTHVWVDGGQTMACLSGAASIDFQFRKEGVSWWREEMPLPEHVDQLAARAAGVGQIDVLITHDAPQSAIDVAGLYGSSSGWSDRALAYARRSSEVIDLARRTVTPSWQVVGHHHVRRSVEVDGTRVEFLGADSMASPVSGSTVVEQNLLLLVDGEPVALR